MLIQYSSGKLRDTKVISVFIGGRHIPSQYQCQIILAMDPEIESPVLVVPFGGLPFDNVADDESVARTMISQNTPNFMKAGFQYRCTRIRGLLLIKVLAQKPCCCSQPVQYGNDTANNINLN